MPISLRPRRPHAVADVADSPCACVSWATAEAVNCELEGYTLTCTDADGETQTAELDADAPIHVRGLSWHEDMIELTAKAGALTAVAEAVECSPPHRQTSAA